MKTEEVCKYHVDSYQARDSSKNIKVKARECNNDCYNTPDKSCPYVKTWICCPWMASRMYDKFIKGEVHLETCTTSTGGTCFAELEKEEINKRLKNRSIEAGCWPCGPSKTE